MHWMGVMRRIFHMLIGLCISVLALEYLGHLLGLRPSTMIYHHTMFNDQKHEQFKCYGIDVLGGVAVEDYPPRWSDNALLADQTHIKPLTQKYVLSRFFRVANSFLNKYPENVIKENIKYIYLLDEITVQGNSYAGTYSAEKASLYVLNQRGAKPSTLEGILHHEFSSILLHKYNFDTNEWLLTHREGFYYEIEKDPTFAWMLINGHVDSVDDDNLLEQGLLRQYAHTGIENDFNIYADVIFSDPSRMKHLIQNYPVIARKYRVFKQFYLSIDPGFSRIFKVIDDT